MSQRWEYSDTIEKERQAQLLSVKSFAVIPENIAREMSILCYHLQGCDDDSRYARPVFCVQVSGEVFDAFFNSPKGYRACYFESPFHGLECNRHLLERLLPRLSEWAIQNSPTYNAKFSQDALLAVSAKAWLAEVSQELCSHCEGEWSRPSDDQTEIFNGRWDASNLPDSKFGRKAPRGSKIRLFGAFLSSRGDEFIPARKRERHQQIHWQGWS
jgi:hypothetical protein